MLRLIEKFLTVWAEGARRGGIAIVFLFLALAGAAGYWGVTHLKVNTDTSEMLDPDLPFQKNAAALRAAFPQIKTDLIIIARAPTLDEADAFAAELRERLLARPELFTSVFSPAEEPFFRKNGLLYLSESELSTRLTQMTKAAGLIETLIKSPNIDTLFATLADNDKLAEKSDLGKETLTDIYAELAAVIDASMKDQPRPFSWMGALDNEEPPEDGYLRLVYATPVLDYSRLKPAKPAMEAIRAEAASIEAQYGERIDLYVTGDPALRAEELESVTTGIGLSFLLSFLTVTALLIVAFRSWTLSLMTMVALIITLSLTAAFAAFAIGELNLVSVAFTVLLVGLGLDFAIHLLLHIQERRADGQSTKDALKGSMHEVGPGLMLAAGTTALGFFAFIPTEFKGIAQLGAIAGAGVIIALFVSLTFLPAGLGALPKPQVRKASGGGGMLAVFQKLSGPTAILITFLGVASLVLAPQARFDADPMSLRNPDSPSVKGFNLLFSDEETIPYRLSLLVSSAEEAEAASAQAKELSVVRSTRSLPDFVPDDQDAKLELVDFANGSLAFALDAEPNSVPGPEKGSGAAALEARLTEAYSDGPAHDLALLLKTARESEANDPDLYGRIEKNIFAYWPQLIDRLRDQMMADYVELGDLPEALSTRYRSGDEWRIDILPAEDVRDPKALSRFVTAVEAIFPNVSGGAIQTQKAGAAISHSMLEATSIALAVISIFLWLLVRRLSAVFLMLMPLALAAALTTAAGVLFDIPFNYANVIVLPLLMGIGVDSGIHLVLRQDQVKAGEGIYGTSTPRAVLFSALTTVASFGSLMLSPHRGTASMGELLSIAIAFTLVCTLIVLPAAFNLDERRRARAAARKG
ncbi:MAG TPA: MMPL family transporter [Parvularculaceae bacterium]|nr:MMPL family transporter [Parvularculaceae bacterium]HRX38367.1 MMPL family transporter [Parvularculaceae bacterium]